MSLKILVFHGDEKRQRRTGNRRVADGHLKKFFLPALRARSSSGLQKNAKQGCSDKRA